LSFILLDWGCRERFSTLDWLRQENVPKAQYELIWMELYDRVVEEVMENADIVITCHQPGVYCKHMRGKIFRLYSSFEETSWGEY
jgi:hypothetical protein